MDFLIVFKFSTDNVSSYCLYYGQRLPLLPTPNFDAQVPM